METKMIIPVAKPYRITSKYGERILNGTKEFHHGIDFVSTTGLRDVYAVLDGEVVYDKNNYDHNNRWTKSESGGNMIILKHTVCGKIYYTRYLHLVSNRVSKNDRVHKGMLIGSYADVGRSFGAHLHFDLWDGKWTRINPTQWFTGVEEDDTV
jgi:murein DD-endopeptidase MepM/ murein hydrolase activator NlpD